MRKPPLHTYILSFFAILCLFLNRPAQAEFFSTPTIKRITATYMVPHKEKAKKEGEEDKNGEDTENNKPHSRYDVLASWEVSNHREWKAFAAGMKNLPKGAFPSLSEEDIEKKDIIMIKVETTSGEYLQEITFLNETITVKDSIPTLNFFHDSKNFYGFLEDTRKKKRASGALYDVWEHEKGLIIEHDSRENLPDPAWSVTDSREIDHYLSFTEDLPALGYDYTLERRPFETKNNYIITFTPKDQDLPDKILATPSELITFKEHHVVTLYRDTEHYFDFFRKKALEVAEEEQKELERRKEIAKDRAERKRIMEERIRKKEEEQMKEEEERNNRITRKPVTK